MLNLQYLGEETFYEVSFRQISKNIVEIKGDFPVETNGFTISRIGNVNAFTGNYSEFTTVYKEIAGGVQFSNDGSVYVEPVPIINFRCGFGGTIDGETTQEAKDYSELIVPTPIADTDYEFLRWRSEIPESGEIKNNKTFTAMFISTLPEPEPEPTIDERVTALEGDVKAINDALGG